MPRSVPPRLLTLLLSAVCCLLTACSSGGRGDVFLVTLEGVGSGPDSSDALPRTLSSLGIDAGTHPGGEGGREGLEGWTADVAITPSPVASAAAASMLTGRPVAGHGVTDPVLGRLDASVETLAHSARRDGRATGAFFGSRGIDWRTGLSRGFERFDEAPGEFTIGPADILAVTTRQGWEGHAVRRSPLTVVNSALQWMRTIDEPAFAWIHLSTDPGRPSAGTVAARPASGPDEIDRAVESLVQGLRDLGRFAGATVVIAGTNGTAGGRHGEWTSGLGVFDATVRVPLIVRGPEGGIGPPPAGIVSTRRAATILAGAMTAGGEHDPVPEGEAVSVSFAPLASYGWSPVALFRTGSLAYMDGGRTPDGGAGTPGTAALYDLASDPGQETDLMEREPGRGADLASRLAGLDPYGGLHEDVDTAGAPKEAAVRRRVLESLVAGAIAAEADDAAGAEPLIEKALSLDPANLSALRLIARISDETGDTQRFDRAIDTLGGLSERSPYAAATLARVLRETGRAEAAVAPLEAAVERWPSLHALRLQLAAALGRTDAYERAADVLLPVVEASPDDPRLQERLGDVYFAAGNAYRASSAYEACLSLGFDPPRVVVKIGDTRMRLNDPEGALERFQQLAEARPDLPSSWVRMGDALLELDRTGEAVEAYRKVLPKAPGEMDQALTMIGQLVEKSKFDAALLLYQDLWKANPERYEPHAAIGEVFLRSGRTDDARKAFEYALEKAPGEAGLHHQLVRVAIAKDDAVEALRQVRLFVKKGTRQEIRAAMKDPAIRNLPEGSPVRAELARASGSAQG